MLFQPFLVAFFQRHVCTGAVPVKDLLQILHRLAGKVAAAFAFAGSFNCFHKFSADVYKTADRDYTFQLVVSLVAVAVKIAAEAIQKVLGPVMPSVSFVAEEHNWCC